MFDRNAPAPEMSINISLGDFHDTHDAASQARDLVIKKGVKKLSTSQLKKALSQLSAGQRLTNAETGPDAAYATSYADQIQEVTKEIKQRKAR